MRRTLPLLLLIACDDGLLAAQEQVAYPSLREADGGWTATYQITVGVEERARGLETGIEMILGGFIDRKTDVDMAFTDGRVALPALERTVHTGRVAALHTPDFVACDGLGAWIGEDGRCEVTLFGQIVLTADASPTLEILAHTPATGGWSPEDVGLSLVVTDVTEVGITGPLRPR